MAWEDIVRDREWAAKEERRDHATDTLRFLELQAQVQAENQRFVTLAEAMREARGRKPWEVR